MINLEEIVIACYNEHKTHTNHWTYGEPQKAYFDLEGLKIIYSNGKYWHYKPISEKEITWW